MSPFFATRFLPCDLGDGVGAFGVITSRLSVRDADFRRDHPILDGVDDPPVIPRRRLRQKTRIADVVGREASPAPCKGNGCSCPAFQRIPGG